MCAGVDAPDYLEDLPASYGFDPLRLGANPDSLKWYASIPCMAAQVAARLPFSDVQEIPKFVCANSVQVPPG